MNYSIVLVLLLGTGLLAMSAMAVSKTPVAATLLSEKEAVALVGGPLGEVFKNEELPTMQNGHDHNSVCGFFPKGYNIQTADRPPERGVQLQLHAMRTNAEAKTFYEHTLSMNQKMAGMPGPFAGNKITLLKGMGEVAFLLEQKSEPESGSSYEIASVTFVKGNVMAQLMVWKKAASATEIAKNAAKQVLSKLP
jgi:hypothetical protein